MTGARTATVTTDRADPGRFADSVMEPKLQWPTSRTSWVPRARLIEDLDRASRHPVALVAAPAGYGKTTLLAQWLTRPEAPIAAWVTLDAGDNDPGRFWTHVAAALERAGCPLSTGPGGTFRPVNGSDVMTTALPRMLDALSSLPHDIVIALDDFHCIQESACHAQVQFLIENLPSRAHVVISTRADPGLRLGRLRASGLVAEVRAEHLSFTVDETSALLANEDVHLSERLPVAAREPHRGLARGPLPRDVLPGRPDRPGRLREPVQRREPVPR